MSIRLAAVLLTGFVSVLRPIHAETPLVRTADGSQLWVVDPWGGRVSLLSTVSGTRLAEVHVGGDPRSLALTRDGARLFVAVPAMHQVVVVDTGRRRVAARFAVPGGGWNLVLTPNDTRLFVALRDRDAVAILDPTTGRLRSLLEGAFPNHPHALVATDDGDGDDMDEVVFVAEFSAAGSQIDVPRGEDPIRLPQLHRLSVRDERVLSSQPIALDPALHGGGLPTNLRQLVLHPVGHEVWAIGEQANTARGTRVGGLGGTAPDPEDDRVFVRSDGRFNGPGVRRGTPPIQPILLRFDAATGVELPGSRLVLSDDRPGIDRTPVGGSRALAFAPDGAHVYVANASSMDVTVLDAVTLAEVAVFDVGHFPSGFAFDGDGRLHVLAAHEFAVWAVDVSDPRRPVPLHAIPQVSVAPLAGDVLHGLRLFSSGRNERVLPASRKVSGVAQVSCQSCHPDGRTNGLVWDQTELGKGPRATQDLTEWDQSRRLGWDAFRDEMHDFVNAAARAEAGAHGDVFDPSLPDQTNDPAFGRGSNAGVDADLDATAHALDVLFARFARTRSPHRGEDGALTPAAQRGFDVFVAAGCARCHPPSAGFSDTGEPYDGISHTTPLDPGSNPDTFKWDVGTLGPLDAPSPAARLNLNTGFLAGFDTPLLVHLYQRTTFLHDGRALSLDEVIAHLGEGQNVEHAGTGFLGTVGRSPAANDLRAFLLSLDNGAFTFAEPSGPERLGSTWTYGLLGRPGLVPMVYAAPDVGELTVPGVGTLLLDPANVFLLVDGFGHGLRIQATGELQIPFVIPPRPELIGFTIHVQTALFDGFVDRPAGLSNRVFLQIRS